MALSASSTAEIRPGAGSDTNGGGASNVAGTNLSLQDAAAYAETDIVTAGTTTITSASSNWGTDVADNWIYIAGGTGAIVGNWYRVVTRVSALQLTLDRSTGLTTGTGATGNVGGALATIGGYGALLAGTAVTGIIAWLKAGTNTLTSSTANVSGGKFSTAAFVGAIIGYTSVRGDLNNNTLSSANRPIIDCGAITGISVFATGSAAVRLSIMNVKIDGKGNSTIVGFDQVQTHNCVAVSCTTGHSLAGSIATFCSATSCGVGFACGGTATLIDCFTKSCTTAGVDHTANTLALLNHVSINDQIAVRTGTGVRNLVAVNCTIHEAAADGFNNVFTNSLFISNCITSNVGDGIDFQDAAGSPLTAVVVNNAFRSNGTVYETSPPTAHIAGSITLTGDPYTTEASDDLSPNNTAGAGAALRAAGIDVFGQTDSRDVGAVQHADPAASGVAAPTTVFGMGGVFVG